VVRAAQRLRCKATPQLGCCRDGRRLPGFGAFGIAPSDIANSLTDLDAGTPALCPCENIACKLTHRDAKHHACGAPRKNRLSTDQIRSHLALIGNVSGLARPRYGGTLYA
jgi:hypothetical protein